MDPPLQCAVVLTHNVESWFFMAVNLSSCVGMVASAALLWLAVRNKQRKPLLQRLVLWIAVVDLVMNIENSVPKWVQHDKFDFWKDGSVHNVGSAPLCGLWMGTLRLLQLWSVLIAASIALAMLFAANRKHGLLKLLRHAPLLALPIALCLNATYVVKLPPQTEVGERADCDPTGGVWGKVFAFELITVFLLIAAMHTAAYHHTRSCSPGSVTRRAFGDVTGFLFAFFLTWALPCLDIFVRHTFDPNPGCDWVRFQLQQITGDLSGLFNLIAYWQVSTRPSGSAVTFGQAEERFFRPSPQSEADLQADQGWRTLLWFPGEADATQATAPELGGFEIPGGPGDGDSYSSTSSLSSTLSQPNQISLQERVATDR